jgi:uncharacterized protein YbbK (DUF523 family)
MQRPLLVSACLIGKKCRFDGGSSKLEVLENCQHYIPVCPEEQGDLSTPRPPAELQGSATSVLRNENKVINVKGEDVTEQFIQGALKSLNIAQENNVNVAILKSNSPTCGYGKIYDGSFSKTLINGNGIFAQLCINNKIDVISSDDKLQIMDVVKSEKGY